MTKAEAIKETRRTILFVHYPRAEQWEDNLRTWHAWGLITMHQWDTWTNPFLPKKARA